MNIWNKEVFLENKDKLYYFKVTDNGVEWTYISWFTVSLHTGTW